MPPSPTVSFEDAWRHAAAIEGWLTEEQARVLYDEAARVAPDRVVEIGSHHGRSTVVLASTGARVTAVDPFPDDWRYGRPDTEARLREHLAAAGVAQDVEVVVATSAAVRADWDDEVRLVYVDGKHDHWSCRDDLRWAEHVRPGDTVLVHDAFSSLGVTSALVRDALTGSTLRYVDRTGSLARFAVGAPSPADRARVLRELPWFARNLVVKVALRLRLRRLASVIGHHDTADPY